MFGMHAKCMVGLSLIHYQGENQSIVLISFINNKHWPLGEVVLKSIPLCLRYGFPRIDRIFSGFDRKASFPGPCQPQITIDLPTLIESV